MERINSSRLEVIRAYSTSSCLKTSSTTRTLTLRMSNTTSTSLRSSRGISVSSWKSKSARDSSNESSDPLSKCSQVFAQPIASREPRRQAHWRSVSLSHSRVMNSMSTSRTVQITKIGQKQNGRQLSINLMSRMLE